MTAWPASGDSVTPSDSKCGQVGIMPTIPSLRAVVGQALSPEIGSIVPTRDSRPAC